MVSIKNWALFGTEGTLLRIDFPIASEEIGNITGILRCTFYYFDYPRSSRELSNNTRTMSSSSVAQLFIEGPFGSIVVAVDPSQGLESLKATIADRTGIPADCQRITCGGKDIRYLTAISKSYARVKLLFVTQLI